MALPPVLQSCIVTPVSVEFVDVVFEVEGWHAPVLETKFHDPGYLESIEPLL